MSVIDYFLDHSEEILNGFNFGESNFNAIVNSETQAGLQQGHFELQNQLLNSRVQQQQNFFDFQRQQQQNAFAQQTALNDSNNQLRQTMQQTAINSAWNMMGMSSGIGAVANIAATGLNYLTNSALMNQQASLQRENYAYSTGLAKDAYQSSGLPGWLAFTNGASASMFPRTSQVVNGFNSFNSQLPGNVMNVPYIGTPSQNTFGVGNMPTAS